MAYTHGKTFWVYGGLLKLFICKLKISVVYICFLCFAFRTPFFFKKKRNHICAPLHRDTSQCNATNWLLPVMCPYLPRSPPLKCTTLYCLRPCQRDGLHHNRWSEAVPKLLPHRWPRHSDLLQGGPTNNNNHNHNHKITAIEKNEKCGAHLKQIFFFHVWWKYFIFLLNQGWAWYIWWFFLWC